MRVPANDLRVGDVLQLNDWQLHVVAVEFEAGAAVRTTEFDFLLHLKRDESVNVVRPDQGPPAAA